MKNNAIFKKYQKTKHVIRISCKKAHIKLKHIIANDKVKFAVCLSYDKIHCKHHQFDTFKL